MTSIAFVVPTWKYFDKPFQLQPILELYHATFLRDSGFDVDIIDLRHYRKLSSGSGISFSDFCDRNIPEKDLYFYWSPKTADFYDIKDIVEFIQKKYPKSKHAAGGTHVDYNVVECSGVFDAVMTGPGERSMLQILEDFSNNKLKKLYSDDWKKVHYKDYAFMRRDFLPRESIVTELFKEYGNPESTCVLFSRGCPFKCSFCVYNTPNTLQVREDIEEEINYLKSEYGIEAILLKDEVCVGFSKRIYVPLLESIKRSNITWRGQTVVGIPHDLLALAKESGCIELVLGVETVFQELLDKINKKQTVEQCEDTIAYCNEIGITTRLNLIFGLPDEPKNVVEKTIEFIEKTNPGYVSVSGLCPIPGSDMYANPDKYGIKFIDKDWDKHAHLMFRYDDQEDHGLPFEYKDGFKREEIVENIKTLQKYLQEKNMVR